MKTETPTARNEENDPINRFANYLREGMRCWLQAGEIVRQEIAKNPDWPEEVAAKFPFINVATVRRFANIGLKYIPELAIDCSPGGKYLAKLPLELQRKYYSDPIPTLVYNQGNPECLLISLHNLTSNQAAQVFAADHIRTEAEQRSWRHAPRRHNRRPARKA